tara:strand:+ start:404 stop:913 length:510 start_codon:yes stop_codon:yes gene_type:complete
LRKLDLHKLIAKDLQLDLPENFNFNEVPLPLTVKDLFPKKFLFYAYEITDPPGGRSPDENKIQIILPEQQRGERGNFDHRKDYFTILLGYRNDIRVYCLWDAYLYEDIPFSRNIQVKEATLTEALSNNITFQERKLWVGPETIISCNQLSLKEALPLRHKLYLKSLSSE